ncbi:hypothetical protein HanRHA438_Chr03g0132171 [Helianthus annuus]|nr:hypothetical protein HanRHA438_Chr03g0132171 [Helianthus annuus]
MDAHFTTPKGLRAFTSNPLKIYIHSTKKQLLYQYISTKNKYFFSLLFNIYYIFSLLHSQPLSIYIKKV